MKNQIKFSLKSLLFPSCTNQCRVGTMYCTLGKHTFEMYLRNLHSSYPLLALYLQKLISKGKITKWMDHNYLQPWIQIVRAKMARPAVLLHKYLSKKPKQSFGPFFFAEQWSQNSTNLLLPNFLLLVFGGGKFFVGNAKEGHFIDQKSWRRWNLQHK